jgi:hypothetical protein
MARTWQETVDYIFSTAEHRTKQKREADSRPVDDAEKAEPEWIGKVLLLAERVTSDSPTSPLAEKRISQYKQP